MIFNLPVGAFAGTGIKSSLVVLENNNNESKSLIRMAGKQMTVKMKPLFDLNKIIKDLKSGAYQSKFF